MTFDETLARVLAVLQREGRVSYRALRRRFDLDEEYLGDLKAEIIQAKKLAVDEDGAVLVWTGDTAPPSAPMPTQERVPLAYTPRHLAEKILTSRAALTGERKQVTVLFCDLANSTALAERLGPEAMHTLLQHFFELALHEIHRYEGTVNQFLGDGFMALFGAPVAHEDHARRAVLAALGLQRSLRSRGSQPLPVLPLGEDLSVRMGLNTGLVVVGSIGDNLRMDYTAIGDTTNLAARLQQVAEPDTILISETMRRLVQGAIRLEALPVIQVKGKAEPVMRYKVLGLGPRRAPLAGREERAAQRAQRALEEGGHCCEDATMGKAYYVLARDGFWSGPYLHGLAHGQHAVALLERTPERWWLGQSHWVVSINYYFMGAFTQALADAAQAHVLGEALGDPRLQQGLEITRDCRYQHGIGWAQPALGRIAQVSGTLAEAETHYMAALQTFTSTQGRFEVGRTHLALAELAHAQGNRDAATAHVNNAHALFMALQILRYVEQTQQFASTYGLLLSNADTLPTG